MSEWKQFYSLGKFREVVFLIVFILAMLYLPTAIETLLKEDIDSGTEETDSSIDLSSEYSESLGFKDAATIRKEESQFAFGLIGILSFIVLRWIVLVLLALHHHDATRAAVEKYNRRF